ncbi:hypothetical protein V5799_027156 [Amblyomma americanum]|uniref:Secreted protein n=1 Tax=Amblyomma americanum TaxID=6943 RepID=A0AAQ4DGI6_AMBAM
MRTLLVVLGALLVLDVALARRYTPKVCEPYWGAAEALSGCRRYEKCVSAEAIFGETASESVSQEEDALKANGSVASEEAIAARFSVLGQ